MILFIDLFVSFSQKDLTKEYRKDEMSLWVDRIRPLDRTAEVCKNTWYTR